MKSTLYTLVIISLTLICTQCKQSDANVGYTNLSVPEAKAMLQDRTNLYVVDVRTPEEVRDGKIEGALELDFYGPTFDKQLNLLVKDKKYVVYCRSGNRSSKTADKMINMGFSDVYNIEGGYSAWTE